MHASERVQINALKQLFHKRANRGIFDGPDREPGEIRTQLDRRYNAQARLNSLQDDYRILFFFDECNGDTLNCVLFTLRDTDLWEEGPRKFDGNIEDHADQLSYEREYEENFQADRQRQRDNEDMRYRGREAYTHLKLRTGQRLPQK